jgi:hypothetical protein
MESPAHIDRNTHFMKAEAERMVAEGEKDAKLPNAT